MINKILQTYALLFSKKVFYKMNQFLFHLSLRGLGVFNSENPKLSGEYNLLKKLNYKKNEKKIFIDIGANNGDYSKQISILYPNSIIYAFEPHPTTFQRLKEGLDNKCITLINKAVSNINGKTYLYDYASDTTGSSHASTQPNVIENVHHSKSVSYEIDVITLDKFIVDNQINKVDFLKIDVEGGELNVMKGLQDSINNDLIDIIQFEITQINSTTKVFMNDFYKILYEKYSFFRLLPNSLLPLEEYTPWLHEIFGYQNIVALRRNTSAEKRFKD